jgi:GT2 family glycosyltransferase
MNRVAIVVLNWNGIEDTARCLDSLLVQDYSPFKIIVIDNGSSDDSRDILEKYQKDHPKELEVLYNKQNLGFTGGVNTGISWALRHNYEFVALFNNDAVAEKTWLSHLVTAMNSPKTGITTGLLLRSDGKKIDSTGEQYSIWGISFSRGRGENKIFADPSGFTFGATGGATLYKTELFQDIGLFDTNFFAYYEDIDISFRAQLAGWKIMYVSEAIAYHKQGATSSKLPGFTVYQTFKNLPWVFIKNVPRQLLLTVGIRLLVVYTLFFWNAVFHGNGWPALSGSFKSIVFFPKKIGQRWHIQKQRRVPLQHIKGILWNDLPPDQKALRKLFKKG